MGISRQTVSTVLNSNQARAPLEEIERRLAVGIDDAITTVLATVKTDFGAAKELLRGFGAFKVKLDVNHEAEPTLAELVGASMRLK